MYTISHPHAIHAIIAAEHRHDWGNFASRQYAKARGVPMNLYILACVLQAAEEGVKNG